MTGVQTCALPIYVFNELKPKKGDVVIAQWSGISRYDSIIGESVDWTTPGNLNWQDAYPIDEFVKPWFNIVERAYEYVSYITSIAALAKQSEATFINTNMFDPWHGMFYGEPFQTDVFNSQLKYINRYFPKELMERTCQELNFPTSIEEYQWQVGPFAQPYLFNKKGQGIYDTDLPEGTQRDTHPTTKGHHEYAKYIDKLYELGCNHIYSDAVKSVVDKVHADQTDPTFSFKKSRKDKMYDPTATHNVSYNPEYFYEKAKAKGHYFQRHHSLDIHGYSNDPVKRWLKQ